MKKILHLTLKKKWFDLIACGKKEYEYREDKPYWQKRLMDKDGFAIEFDEIHFRNGYGKNAPFMRVEWKGLRSVDEGWPTDHQEELWKDTLGIVLGEVLEVRS